MKLQSIKSYNTSSFQKIAIKSIFSVLSTKVNKPVRKVFSMLNEFRQYFPKKIETPKIAVKFHQ